MPRRTRAASQPTPLHRYLAGNAFVRGDNLDVLRQLPDECVDLIYLDPPFNSNQFYVAAFGDKGGVAAQLRDIWRWNAASELALNNLETLAFRSAEHQRLLDCVRGVRLQAGETSNMAAYILYMAPRLMEMRRILKQPGSVYLHCDPHANAYLRILMDAVFGEDQFRNEIVWCYTGPSNTRRWFPRKHDTLYFYCKDDKSASTFNRDDVRISYKQLNIQHSDSEVTTGIGGRLTPENVQEFRERGKVPEDYWLEDRDGMSPTGRLRSEYLGYPTQKPLALLERIIKASSNPGDLVLDPFCGCGTAADAAASLGRKYLGIDISGIAVRVMQQRLESRGDAVSPVVYGLEWTDFDWREFERRALMPRDDAEDGTPGWQWAEDKVAALLNAVPNTIKTGDGGIDARYFGAMDTARNESIIIPIQVKMWRTDRPVGRPEMDRLLGVQTSLQNRGLHAPMSLMVSLYPPTDSSRAFAAQQGRVTLTTLEGGAQEYPVMQALSVQEMLQHDERPKLPPVDPRSLVGDTQDKLLLT